MNRFYHLPIPDALKISWGNKKNLIVYCQMLEPTEGVATIECRLWTFCPLLHSAKSMALVVAAAMLLYTATLFLLAMEVR